jgi:sugar O-acyltransferase (sialic acid O-acetyltransferase NeuD family)
VKKRLFIIGAGGFGRELEAWLQSIASQHRDWKLAGYLDENPDALKGNPSRLSIVGAPLEYPFKRNDAVIIGIADPKAKAKMHDLLKDRVQVPTFVHPTAIIGNYIRIGEGSIICAYCSLSSNVQLGCCVMINAGTLIGHDVVIGDWTSVMSNTAISGKCQIGDHVFVGSGATILPSIRIAPHSTVGAGSVVIRNVRARSTVFGNPAVCIMEKDS